MTVRLQNLAVLLADGPKQLADRIVNADPWLCGQLGVNWSSWSRQLLLDRGFANASLHLVGSAAIGCSLSPENAGRPFRFLGGLEKPSDLDIALVDTGLFQSCWDEMVRFERQAGPTYLNGSDREHVYWGRIDDYRVPHRTAPRAAVRALLDACRRAQEFRGYPATLRVYRRLDDLSHYVLRGLNHLGRTIL